MNVTLFGKRLFADGSKDKVILELDGLMVQYVQQPYKRRETDRHTGRALCEDRQGLERRIQKPRNT